MILTNPILKKEIPGSTRTSGDDPYGATDEEDVKKFYPHKRG